MKGIAVPDESILFYLFCFCLFVFVSFWCLNAVPLPGIKFGKKKQEELLGGKL